MEYLVLYENKLWKTGGGILRMKLKIINVKL